MNLREVIRAVLDETENEHIVTNDQVDALTDELVAALESTLPSAARLAELKEEIDPPKNQMLLRLYLPTGTIVYEMVRTSEQDLDEFPELRLRIFEGMVASMTERVNALPSGPRTW